MNTDKIQELKAEQERNLLKIQQTQHQIDRLKKREEYLKNREKSTRTHRLCNLGGVVEHFIPEAKTMDRSSFFQLMERLIAIPEVADILKQYGGDDTSQSSTSM